MVFPDILFACFLLSTDFFSQNQNFQKIILGIPSECQTVWIQIQIRSDILSSLLWVQTVCKDDIGRQRVNKVHVKFKDFSRTSKRLSLRFQRLKTYEKYRGSYMSAYVLLNLLNELRKRDKMRGLLSILSLFRNKFNKFNNTRARMLDSFYHVTLRLL